MTSHLKLRLIELFIAIAMFSRPAPQPHLATTWRGRGF